MECHKCGFNGKGDAARCIACSEEAYRADRRGEMSSLHVGGRGTVSLDSVPNPDLIIRHARPMLSAPSAQATALPADAEDALRQLLATFVGLEDYDALLLLHIARGESIADAVRSIGIDPPTQKGNERGGGFDRRHGWARLSELTRRFKPFEALVSRIRPRVRPKPVIRSRQLELGLDV